MNQYSNQRVITGALWRPLVSHFRMKCSGINPSFSIRMIMKRCYASESSKSSIPKKFRKPLLPFETESSSKDVLLFTYHGKERLYKAIGFVGIFLCCACMNSAELIYRFLSQIKNTPVEKEIPWYQWWKSINYESKYLRIGASGLLVLFGK